MATSASTSENYEEPVPAVGMDNEKQQLLAGKRGHAPPKHQNSINENCHDRNEDVNEGVEDKTAFDVVKEELRTSKREFRILKVVFLLLVPVLVKLAVIIFICSLLTATVYVPLKKTILKSHDSAFQPKSLSNRGGEYGIVSLKHIDSCTHKTVEVKINGNSAKSVELVVVSDGEIKTSFVNESLHVNQSEGVSPGNNEGYVYGNLTYGVNVTGPVGTKFTVNVTRTGEDGNECIVSSQRYSILNSFGVFVSYKSNVSGIYAVQYDVSQNATVHQEGYFNYTSINISYYKEFGHRCITDEDCTVPIPFELSDIFRGVCKDYSAIAIIDSSEDCLLSVTSNGRLDTYVIAVEVVGIAAGLLICLVGFIVTLYTFLCKKIKKPNPP